MANVNYLNTQNIWTLSRSEEIFANCGHTDGFKYLAYRESPQRPIYLVHFLFFLALFGVFVHENFLIKFSLFWPDVVACKEEAPFPGTGIDSRRK